MRIIIKINPYVTSSKLKYPSRPSYQTFVYYFNF